MKIILNGQNEIIKDGTSICELVGSFGIDKESCIVLVDDEIIPKDEYSKIIYKEANIEILRFVSGG